MAKETYFERGILDDLLKIINPPLTDPDKHPVTMTEDSDTAIIVLSIAALAEQVQLLRSDVRACLGRERS